MELIASQVLGSAAASVTFANIPQGYSALLLKVSARSETGTSQMIISFNGSSANYTFRTLQGSGSAVNSYTQDAFGFNNVAYLPTSASTASTFGSAEILLPNYAGATNKSVSITAAQETNATAAILYTSAGLWSQTAAITSLTLGIFGSANFVTASTFYLYGLY